MPNIAGTVSDSPKSSRASNAAITGSKIVSASAAHEYAPIANATTSVSSAPPRRVHEGFERSNG